MPTKTKRSADELASWLRLRIMGNASGEATFKRKTILKKLGIRRLTQKSRQQIDEALQRAGICASLGKDDGDWSEASQDAPLIFTLAPSRASRPAARTTSLSSPSSNDTLSFQMHVIANLEWHRAQAEAPASQPKSSRHGRAPKEKPPSGTKHPAEPLSKENPNIGIVTRQEGRHPLRLFRHQQAAVTAIDEALRRHTDHDPFAGLIVIPTGGGKTRTVVHWLMKNVLAQGGRVLWIAHRTELLNQAFLAFRHSAYSDVLGDRERLRLHLVSGQHDPGFKIHPEDDVLIASIHSVRPGAVSGDHLVKKWLSRHAHVFLVIDEAHHAPARTYRQLIDVVRRNSSPFRMLGLTATPFRTAKREQGHIAALFPDDMVFKTDLRTMINRDVLSKPRFRSPGTGASLRKSLTADDLAALERRNFDWSALGDRAARTIGENQVRNRAIVDHYLKNKTAYGQTLVFALNVPNAIALHTLFEDAGVPSACVVGEIRDERGVRNVSPSVNAEAIMRFRANEIKVLVNVNILTEGTDLPNTQTVFLARPTTSKTLMMQMIGRGLRGKKANGTEETFIVSFIDDDDWEGRIVWVNPEQLFIEENIDFDDRTRDTQRRVVRLISIDMLQQYTRLLNDLAESDGLAAIPFLERIPLGIYSFSLLPASSDEDEKICDVLVYNSNQEAYARFLAALPELFDSEQFTEGLDGDRLDEKTLGQLADRIEDAFFIGLDRLPGYRREDLCDILQYYFIYELPPDFIEFKQRKKFDIDRVAAAIFEQGMGGKKKVDYLDRVWESDKAGWQAFFGLEHKRYFVNEVALALRRIEYPELFRREKSELPGLEHPQEELSRFSLQELRTTHPEYYRWLQDKVYELHKRDDEFVSAQSGVTSDNRFKFEIDHKVPRSAGGLTTLDNLQLLTLQENRMKGTKVGS